jgi:hypothetical protein
MLRVHKNALLKEILKFGYNRAKFHFEEGEEISEGIDAYVKYEGNVAELTFRLINSDDNFHLFKYSYDKFSPGSSYEKSPGYDRDQWIDFDAVLKAYRNWLETEVKAAEDESLVPDLWVQLEQERDFLNLRLSEAKQEPFTQNEKEQIRIALKNFEVLLLGHFKLEETELRVTKEMLDYCADALDRLPRFDWRALMLTTIIQISITLSLDTNRGRELWALFLQAINFVRNLLS